jgi:type II secretory pathway pseudopilin PulG
MKRLKKLGRTGGFSLVELVGVIVVIVILCAVILVVSGTARTSTLTTRVNADLEAINSAKTHWCLDNPGATFPNDEPSRFTCIQNYLDPVQATGMTNFEAPNVQYYINAIGTPADSSPAFTQ